MFTYKEIRFIYIIAVFCLLSSLDTGCGGESTDNTSSHNRNKKNSSKVAYAKNQSSTQDNLKRQKTTPQNTESATTKGQISGNVPPNDISINYTQQNDIQQNDMPSSDIPPNNIPSYEIELKEESSRNNKTNYIVVWVKFPDETPKNFLGDLKLKAIADEGIISCKLLGSKKYCQLDENGVFLSSLYFHRPGNAKKQHDSNMKLFKCCLHYEPSRNLALGDKRTIRVTVSQEHGSVAIQQTKDISIYIKNSS